jgi:hypothetical protein
MKCNGALIFHCRMMLCLMVVFTFVGCHKTSSKFTFEPQPREILAAGGVKNSRGPQMAVSASGNLSLLALYDDGATARVGFTMSHDGGDHFMPIRAVSEEGVTISAHGENNPAMVTSGRTVYALWEQSGNDGNRDIVLSRSLNEGMTFEKPVRVNDNSTPSFHGFASLAADPKGGVYVVWLDGRDKPESAGTFDVYLAHSTDRGATFVPNTRVARTACPCCRPAVAIGSNGEVFVAWRRVFPGSIRDMMLSVSKDGGQTFPQATRVADDGWEINGCPESGATISVDAKNLYVAWMTGGKDSHARIRVASSDDGGLHFRTAQSASEGIRDPNHPVFTKLQNGKLLLSFQGRPVSHNGQWNPTAAFVAEILDDKCGTPVSLGGDGKSASYPATVAGPTGNIFVAWSAAGDQKSSVALIRGHLQ